MVVDKRKLSVVIPCYKSEKTIAEVVENIVGVLEQKRISNYEIVLVNDNSPDDTWRELKKLAEKCQYIKVINLAKNVGQHNAIMAGFNVASGDLVVVCDDDGQTPIEVIDTMVKKIDEGYDVVTTKWSGNIQKSRVRRMGTRINNKMNEVLLGMPKGMVLSIFFMARSYVIKEMVNYRGPYPFITGLLIRTTHNIGVVEVEQLERKNGTSGYTFKKLLSLWMNGFTAFSVIPLRIAAFIGTTSALFGFIYGIFIIIRKIVCNNISAGWSSIIAVMLFMFGIVLCVLGIMGEYLGRIYMCINEMPQYVVCDTVNIDKEE